MVTLGPRRCRMLHPKHPARVVIDSVNRSFAPVMLQYKCAVSHVALVCVLIVTNVACRRNYRFSACDEIEAAGNALQGDNASAAVATLRKHARPSVPMIGETPAFPLLE